MKSIEREFSKLNSKARDPIRKKWAKYLDSSPKMTYEQEIGT